MRRISMVLCVLALAACEEDSNVTTRVEGGHDGGVIKWQTKSGSVDKGLLDVAGEKGKVRIDWDYVPVTVATLTVLTLLRRRVTAC